MEIRELISNNLSKFDSWYDVAAFCYDYLVSTIKDQELFIGEYVLTNNKAENKNPNLELLKNFEADSNKIICNNRVDVNIGIELIMKLLHKEMGKLNTYGDFLLNQSTFIFFLLAAIDRYAGNMRNLRRTPAPLNQQYREKSFIYFTSPRSLFQEAASELHFRKTITDTSIRHCLSNLCILDLLDRYGEEAPNIIPLSFNIEKECPDLLKEEKYLNEKNKVLKVALIPFWGQKITNFKNTSGAMFEVRYSKKYTEFAINRMETLLETAIDLKANIIVFPEYMCPLSIQQKMGEHLSNLYNNNPTRLKEVLFVVAGSGWTQDNNNVMCIFDRCGIMIGKYYKYSKFHNGNHLERLKNPGKECTIIDIQGFGRILPSICRDVCNEKYTKSLVDTFRPFLLLTSAWSPSVNGGFKNQYDSLTKKYQLVSMLCNCCEAIYPDEKTEKFNKTVNLIATPFKEDSVCSTNFSQLQRKENCYKNCEKHQCMFIVDASFTKESVESKQIILPELDFIHL